MPRDCETMPARAVIARNAVRKANPAFNVTGTSAPTGLHYSWDWSLGPSCTIHFVHLNLFPGRACGSPGNPGKEGATGTGFPCSDAWTWSENSLGFLESDLAANAGTGKMVVSIQHYGFDGWSNTWYNADQRIEMWQTLNKYNTLAVLVGHTHSAGVYAFNGTTQLNAFDTAKRPAGYISVINAPATQKEDGKLNALPSEFMALEASIEADGTGTFRVAQRVGSGWGPVQGTKSFKCF